MFFYESVFVKGNVPPSLQNVLATLVGHLQIYNPFIFPVLLLSIPVAGCHAFRTRNGAMGLLALASSLIVLFMYSFSAFKYKG